MLHLIDRRPNGRGKSAVNRERFLRRYKTQIGRAVKKMIGERRLADMEQRRRGPRAEKGHLGAVVRLRPRRRPRIRAAGQPRIRRRRSHSPAARRGRGGGNGNAAARATARTTFVFSLSREEFMQIFFDDLELPNLARTEIGRTERRAERPGRLHEVGRACQSQLSSAR